MLRKLWIKDTLNNVQDVEFTEYGDDEDEDEDDDMKNNISPLNVLQNDFIKPMIEMESNFNNYLAMIEQVVDLAATIKREYLIKHEFDNVLDKYDKQKKKTKKEMEKCRDNAISALNVDEKNIKLEKHKSFGYCLRIQKSKAKQLKNKKKYQKLSIQKNATYFSESKLRILSNQYKEYEKQYFDRQKLIVNKTIEITKSYISVINQAILKFSELDVILSLANVADKSISGYNLPKIYPSSSSSKNKKMIRMKGARHPCLELLKDIDDGGVIPNDVELIDGKSTTCSIIAK